MFMVFVEGLQPITPAPWLWPVVWVLWFTLGLRRVHRGYLTFFAGL